MKLVAYIGKDEALVCAVEDEARLLKEEFEDRDLDGYDRYEVGYCAEIGVHLPEVPENQLYVIA